MNHKNKIAIVGLGYVGLPLARLFATKYPVVGFDINAARVQELKSGKDATLELEDHLLQSVLLNENPAKDKTGLFCSDQIEDIADSNIYIITVPTPVDKNNRPVLTPLYKSSETVGKVLKKGDIVIYESTVYPGVTEEECIPVLEKVSGLTFFLGKPAIIKESEINAMKETLNHDFKEVGVMDLEKGQKFTIEEGTFKGQEATFLEQKANKIVLRLESLGIKLILEK